MTPFTRQEAPRMHELTCPFCSPDPDDVVLENQLAYARFDRYPVSHGHLLIIPKRHVASLFDATDAEIAHLWDIIAQLKPLIDDQFSPEGYNIGVNDGHAAGQTIMHLHIHLIPRYPGDMDDPKGGVRGVIPERQKY